MPSGKCLAIIFRPMYTYEGALFINSLHTFLWVVQKNMKYVFVQLKEKVLNFYK